MSNWHLRCVNISMVSLCELEGDGCFYLIFADATPGEKKIKMAEYSKLLKTFAWLKADCPKMAIPGATFCEPMCSVIM